MAVPGQIDLSRATLVFSWDFGAQGLGLQRDGGPWRPTWGGNEQSNTDSNGWKRRTQGVSDPKVPGDNGGLYVDDTMPGIASPFSIEADGSLCMTARRKDMSAWWGFTGGWAAAQLNTGLNVPDGHVYWDGGKYAETFLWRPGQYAECEMRWDRWAFPGFWGYNGGPELDIVEGMAGGAGATLHFAAVAQQVQTLFPGVDVSVFHTYGAAWSADGHSFQVYLDRKPIGQPLVAGANWATSLPLILDTQVFIGGWADAGPPPAGINEVRGWFRAPKVWAL